MKSPHGDKSNAHALDLESKKANDLLSVQKDRLLPHAGDLDHRSLFTHAQQAYLKAQILQGRLDLLAQEVLGLKLQPFQQEMLRFCHTIYTQQGEGLLLAPRGFGKSCLATVCFALWLLVKNPNIRILVCSSTSTKAESFVRELKTHLQTNGPLHQLFGVLMDSRCWRQSEVSIKGRTRTSKEASVTARGCSGAVVGLHFDVHLIDDLVNEDNARTQGQREKLLQWVSMSLEPTLQPGGCRLIAGTRYHPHDFYHHVLTWAQQNKGVKTLRLQAIRSDGKSLWPSRFPLQHLTKKRERMGSIRFNAQYQNDCALMQGRVFRQSDLRYYQRAELDMSSLRIVQGIDVAIGQSDKHDWFALVTKGYDAQGRGYTLDIVRGRYSFQQQLLMILYKAGCSAENISQVMGMACTQKDIDALFVGQPKEARIQYGQRKQSVSFGSSWPGVSEKTTRPSRNYPLEKTQEFNQKTAKPSIQNHDEKPWWDALKRFGRGLSTRSNRTTQTDEVMKYHQYKPRNFIHGRDDFSQANDSKRHWVQGAACLRIAIEGVPYQRVLAQYLLQRVPQLPIVCLQQRLDKASRMQLYAARFESHQEFLPSDNSSDALLEELLLFPDGQHDDVLDAHELAHRAAMPLLSQNENHNGQSEVRVFL